MAISRVQCVAAQAATVSFTAPQVGDVIVVFAHRDGSTTAPTVPSGYQNIEEGSGGNTNSAIICYRRSDGTETSTGTFTNATSICAGIYRGCDPNTPIGGWAVNGSTVANNANMTYPAITMYRTDNTSWGLLFGAGRAVTNAGTNAPSGTGTRASATDCAVFDTNATISSRSSSTAQVTASATQGYRAYSIELLAQRDNTFATDPLVQCVSSVSTLTESGNAFQLLFPNATLANNCLVLAFSHTHGTITSVVDDNSVSWTAGPYVTNATTKDTRLYYLLGAASTKKVTVTFSSARANFDFVMAEFAGVATSSAVDGTPTAAEMYCPFLQSGSITTTQAGDLIFQYGHDVWQDASTSSTVCTGISAESGFSLLAASRFTHYGAQYGIKPASGAINPTLLMKEWYPTVGDVFDGPHHSLSIAFKMDGSGTPRPKVMRVVRVHTETGGVNAPTTNRGGQFPSSGNLLAGTAAAWANLGDIMWTGTSDNLGNTWHDARPGASGDCPAMWYASNATTSQHLVITHVWTGTAGSARDWIRLFDIAGADPDAFDTSAEANGTQSAAGADITNAPVITPVRANGLIIATGGTPQGPTSGCYSPTGVYFDNHIYTGETDFGVLNNGDQCAHYYNPDTSQIAFCWHMTNPGPGPTLYYTGAMAFKGVYPALPNKPTIKMQAVNRASTY